MLTKNLTHKASVLAGPQLLPREAAGMLFNAGWVQVENLMKMIGTGMAESLLFTQASHENPDGTTDWGWLQLNDQNKGGNTLTPEKLEAFKQMAFDPIEATAHAREMYIARGFTPWVAFTNGTYTKFVPQASFGIMNMLRGRYGYSYL